MKISTISSIENNKIFCEKFFKDSSPFISYDFFKYLEKTGCTNSNTGWEPEHIIIENNKKTLVLFQILKNKIQMENIFLIMFLQMLTIKLV